MSSKNLFIIITTIALIVVIVLVSYIFYQKDQRLTSVVVENTNIEVGSTSLDVRTTPSDALLVLFNIEDEGQVFKGSELFDRSPAVFEDVEPGLYQLNIDREGYCPVFREVQIIAGRTSILDIELEKEPCE